MRLHQRKVDEMGATLKNGDHASIGKGEVYMLNWVYAYVHHFLFNSVLATAVCLRGPLGMQPTCVDRNMHDTQ